MKDNGIITHRNNQPKSVVVLAIFKENLLSDKTSTFNISSKKSQNNITNFGRAAERESKGTKIPMKKWKKMKLFVFRHH